MTVKRTSGHSDETTESLLKVLNQLAEGEFLKNNRIFILKELDWSHNDQFIQDICSMKNLERLDLWDCELTMEDLVSVFRSCSKLMELRLKDMEMSLVRKFVEPVDQSNFILSGICKRFKTGNKGIDLQQRYSEYLMRCKQ